MPVAHFGQEKTAEPGTILMWAGALADIPSGWVICDGNNGTPNVLDRFVRSGSNPDTTGGQHSYSLSSSHLPEHGHNTVTGTSGSHSHNVQESGYPTGYNCCATLNASGNDFTGSEFDSNGSHSHNVDTVNSTGSGSSIDNRPSYYEVAYIMKT